ncbi:hypothetical protein [Kingella sp. (in: b-proteobacteria)]|nr:hypothetical protein [Kingella sp. (in: b-proteobacteria)]
MTAFLIFQAAFEISQRFQAAYSHPESPPCPPPISPTTPPPPNST